MAFLHLLLAKKNLGDFNVGDFFCSSCGADRPGVARPFSVLGEYLREEVERGRDQQGVTNETPGTGIGGGSYPILKSLTEVMEDLVFKNHLLIPYE